MGHAYLSGLRVALRRWPLVLLLFAVSLAAGFAFSAIGWSWLALSLDNSLATRTLLRDLDMNVFVDLFIHHGESLRTLLLCGIVLAGAFWLLGIWLTACIVVEVGEADIAFGESLRRGVEWFPTYFRLSLIATALNAAAIATAFFVARSVVRWTAESSSEMTFYSAVMVGVVLGGLLLLFLSSIHDHARIRSTAVATGAVAAYSWALRYVLVREWRAAPLTLLLFINAALALLLYQVVGRLVSTDSAAGVIVSLVWGQVLLLARMLLRVWTFAAQSELENISERSD
jgi:hypothetical protein